MTAAPPPALSFKEVAYVAGALRVLDRISFDLAPGERLAVVGANGSGKSCLVRLAAGLIEPSGGDVRLFGERLQTAAIDVQRRLRARLGVALQGGSLLNELTVEDNLRLAVGAIRKLSLTRARARLDRALLEFDLEHCYARMADGLSAGERRRLELARAFIRDPDLLILDDPFDGADTDSAADMEARVAALLSRRPRALLLVTHDLALAQRLSPRVVLLERGRLV